VTLERYSTGLPPLDHVLGGGLVPASVLLLTAVPGMGKTTLSLQALVGLERRCLYVSTEASPEQLVATARRVGAVSDRLYVSTEGKLARIFSHAQSIRAQTIAIDSIQRLIYDDAEGRDALCAAIQLDDRVARLHAIWASEENPDALSVLCDRLYELDCELAANHVQFAHDGKACKLRGKCAVPLITLAKKRDITLWLTAHADADVGTLVYDADTVLRLEHAVLRAEKNRFGPTDAVGYFELTSEGFTPRKGEISVT
jgi:predicted ATP-dependent serine protease